MIGERLSLHRVVVHHNRPCLSQSSSDATDHEENKIRIHEPTSHVEAANGKFSNEQQTKEHAQLGSRMVARPVDIGAIHRARGQVFHASAFEPAGHNVQIFLRLFAPLVPGFIKHVL